ncbi:protein kinase [Kitasatospora sp. NPDC056531]|uniref:protein kinase domain-containing protein n=1 Tax=Kitasatospora sp. NPDC056531 TaxID=3345856 RepID=UPI00369AB767
MQEHVCVGGIAELEPADPTEIGPYQIVGRLGAGGMGRVYLGRSRGGRLVAVKVVRPELAEELGFRRRFAREVDAARRVNGLFTAGVVDADPDGEVAWLATVYVPGVALSEAVAEHGPLPETAVAALGAGLAEALAAIHAAGVIHRDLKPSNVLLSADGPRVIDFGISLATEASALTGTGVLIGTPGFMSPEQLTGAPIGPPSDVFSLGAVLAFAASGQGPFGGGPAHGLMFRGVHAEPDLTGVPERLRELIARCLSKDPTQRPSVTGVLEQLAVSSTGLPDPGSVLDARWMPATVARTVELRSLAVPASPVNPPEATATRPIDPASHSGRAVSASEADEATPATLFEGEAARRPSPGSSAPTEAAASGDREHAPGERAESARKPIPRRAVLALGTLGAAVLVGGAATAALLSQGSGDGPEAKTLTATAVLSGNGQVRSVAFSPDGKTLATGSISSLQLWDVATGKNIATGDPVDAFFVSVAFSPDGKTVALGGGLLQLWDVATGKNIATLGPADHSVWTVAFSPDGKTLATTMGDHTVWLWDAATRKNTAILTGHTNRVYGVAFSPDGKTLATGSWDKTARLWDVVTGKSIATLTGHTGLVYAVEFSPDGKTLAAASGDAARLWDVATEKNTAILTGHTYTFYAVAFSPDGKTLATGMNDYTARLWDVVTGKSIATLTGHTASSIFAVAFSPDGKTLATGSDDETARLWDLTSLHLPS